MAMSRTATPASGNHSAAAPARTDGELAAEHIDGERVVTLSVVIWSRIRLARLDHAPLIAAESGGTGAVNALVGELPASPRGDASPIAP
jgi:hypothetical protein